MLQHLDDQAPLHLISELNHLLMISKLIMQAETSDDFEDSHKYRMIFSTRISRRVNLIAEEIQRPFNYYYDPDGSYKEDSNAFINGLEQYIRQLQSSHGDTISQSDVYHMFEQLRPYGYQ